MLPRNIDNNTNGNKNAGSNKADSKDDILPIKELPTRSTPSSMVNPVATPSIAVAFVTVTPPILALQKQQPSKQPSLKRVSAAVRAKLVNY